MIKKNTRFELTITITDTAYADMLIVALARQGYSPYFGEGNKTVNFEVWGSDLIEIKGGVA